MLANGVSCSWPNKNQVQNQWWVQTHSLGATNLGHKIFPQSSYHKWDIQSPRFYSKHITCAWDVYAWSECVYWYTCLLHPVLDIILCLVLHASMWACPSLSMIQYKKYYSNATTFFPPWKRGKRVFEVQQLEILINGSSGKANHIIYLKSVFTADQILMLNKAILCLCCMQILFHNFYLSLLKPNS